MAYHETVGMSPPRTPAGITAIILSRYETAASIRGRCRRYLVSLWGALHLFPPILFERERQAIRSDKGVFDLTNRTRLSLSPSYDILSLFLAIRQCPLTLKNLVATQELVEGSAKVQVADNCYERYGEGRVRCSLL